MSPRACGSLGSWNILYLIRGGRTFLKVGLSGHSKSPKQGLSWRAGHQELPGWSVSFRNRVWCFKQKSPNGGLNALGILFFSSVENSQGSSR